MTTICKPETCGVRLVQMLMKCLSCARGVVMSVMLVVNVRISHLPEVAL